MLSKVQAAVIDVLNGRSRYERDGTTFDELPKKYTLREKLSESLRPDDTIVDFGGGLGGTFINNRDVLECHCNQFIVVEQEVFCCAGSAIAQDYHLPISFLPSLADLPKPAADIVILSGVLQCIEGWKEVVSQVLKLQPRHIFLDRHPLVDGPTNVFVQENDGYYETKVSYPIRMFNAKELLDTFEDYTVKETWPSDFDPPEYRGFHLIPASVSSRK